MRVAAVFAAVLGATTVVAQNKCAAQKVLEQCLRDYNSRLNNCKPLDYICLCQSNKDILQCYDVCPDDLGAASVQATVTANCVAADQMRATMTTSTQVKTVPTQAAETESSSTEEEETKASETATEEEKAKETEGDKSGAGMVKPAVVLMAGVMAVAAVL